MTKQSYSATEYKFYDDHMEYSEGFLRVEKKSIEYDKIIEVSQTKGVLQKIYGLGSIELRTAADVGKNYKAGINIVNIRQPDKNYNRIKEIVDSKR